MDTSHDITHILSFRQTIVTSPSPTHRFKNVIFEISPSEAVGVFDVKAKFMGVHLETLQLEYQVYMWMMYSDAGMWKRWSNGILWLIFLSFLKYFFKLFLLHFSSSPSLSPFSAPLPLPASRALPSSPSHLSYSSLTLPSLLSPRTSCSCSMRVWLWWSSSTGPPSMSTCSSSCSTRSFTGNRWMRRGDGWKEKERGLQTLLRTEHLTEGLGSMLS